MTFRLPPWLLPLALLTLATRFDVCYPLVYFWAVIAIVAEHTAALGPVGISLAGVVGSLTLIVLGRHVVHICRAGRDYWPPAIFPDPECQMTIQSLLQMIQPNR